MEHVDGERDGGSDGGRTEVTVVHDYFTQRGGAERVAVLLAETLGGGAVTTSTVLLPETFPEVGRLSVRELLPRLPRFLAARRAALGPLAGLGFLLHAVHDGVVVASTSGWAHWMRGRAPRVLYCHTPARWLYEPDDYFRDAPAWLRRVLRLLLSPLGVIDRRCMRSAAVVVANGPVTARRIKRVYGLDAPVVIPPPGLGTDGPYEPVEGVGTDFCLTVARPRGYKNLDLARSVFGHRRQEQLVVVGGTARPVTDQHVLELGRVSDAQLRWLYQHARAVVCVAQEDLGLVPIEAFQFGTPAVALRAGGYLATCIPGRNAVFVESEDAESLSRALDELRDSPLDRSGVRQSSKQFSVVHFSRAMGRLVEAAAACDGDVGRRSSADQELGTGA